MILKGGLQRRTLHQYKRGLLIEANTCQILLQLVLGTFLLIFMLLFGMMKNMFLVHVTIFSSEKYPYTRKKSSKLENISLVVESC